jgi:predicted glycosyltransferase
MNILFTIQHPAHVHLFRHSIQELEQQGHEVHTFARKKDINIELLDLYGIDHTVLADEPSSRLQLPLVQLQYELGVIRTARKIRPDLLIGMGEPAITHAAKLCDAQSLVFTDTEHARVQNTLAFPFADQVYTPECYQGDIGSKQVRYPGYHELAYLHPNRFDPDPSVLSDAGLDRAERFVILRQVSWNAMHDVNEGGINGMVEFVEALEKRDVRVRITAEDGVPSEIVDRKVAVQPHRIHDLMAFADLYVGESATMATESAVLGTPAVYIASNQLGYTNELEAEYGLVFNFSGERRTKRGLERALSILDDGDQTKWKTRHERLLANKVDTTTFIIEKVKEAAN